jgi:Flp pilus assembly protein TadD
LLQSNEIRLAQEQFRIVLKTDTRNVQALNGLATCFFLLDDLSAAEAKLNEARSIQSNDPQTKMNLALLYSKQGRKPEAVALYKEIQSSPDTPIDWKEEATRRLKQLE